MLDGRGEEEEELEIIKFVIELLKTSRFSGNLVNVLRS